ncbi:MAG: NAD(P)H:quinone oxidoreductase [Thermoanaerobacteraceae bacterium]|nr:NAD(P)H:quinone oxidoreductase [Thermoanaerobacteraceae bacterium]
MSINVLICFYSKTGNTYKLAKAIKEGCEEVPGVNVKLSKAKELASIEKIEKDPEWLEAYKEMQDIPDVTVQDVKDCNALIIGSPTRFGNMAAPLKEFLDRLGGVWMRGELINKVGACFTSSESEHEGKEATLLSMMLYLLAQGMIVVGLPQNTPGLGQYGSYYGATATFAPKDEDKVIARALGKRVAQLALQLSGDKND